MLDAIFEHINLSCIAFGFLGAVLHVYNIQGKVSAREVVGYLITGSVLANLIAPQLLKIMTMFPLDFLSLGVGMTAKHFSLLIEAMFSKLDLFGKTKNE